METICSNCKKEMAILNGALYCSYCGILIEIYNNDNKTKEDLSKGNRA